jgi:hypothetical protein
MPIIPVEFNGVFPHRFGSVWLRRSLEHGQCSRRRFWRCARLAPRFPPLVVAQSTRTRIAQVRKRVVRPMPVLPLDIYASPCREVHFHRLWISRCGHAFSIAHRDRSKIQQPNVSIFGPNRRSTHIWITIFCRYFYLIHRSFGLLLKSPQQNPFGSLLRWRSMCILAGFCLISLT